MKYIYRYYKYFNKNFDFKNNDYTIDCIDYDNDSVTIYFYLKHDFYNPKGPAIINYDNNNIEKQYWFKDKRCNYVKSNKEWRKYQKLLAFT